MMTVKELKAQLEQFDESMEIIIVSEHPWKILRKVTEGKVSNIKETRKVVRLE